MFSEAEAGGPTGADDPFAFLQADAAAAPSPPDVEVDGAELPAVAAAQGAAVKVAPKAESRKPPVHGDDVARNLLVASLLELVVGGLGAAASVGVLVIAAVSLTGPTVETWAVGLSLPSLLVLTGLGQLLVSLAMLLAGGGLQARLGWARRLSLIVALPAIACAASWLLVNGLAGGVLLVVFVLHAFAVFWLLTRSPAAAAFR